MSDPITSGDVSSEGDLHARDVITGIQQNFTVIFQQPFQPPPDLTQLRADYLDYLRGCYQHLDMKGLMQVQQVTQQLSLTAVYVPLRAYAGQTEAGERVAGRRMAEIDRLEMAEMAALSRQVEPVPVEEALKADPAVVVLGDPGAGKSTLLKVLVLALAGQPDGPLPILLPLNAYARRLSQGEVNLGQFLGEYYANRQQKLRQVGELFATALANNQAVILLDGLDEVQANRHHLVRLVEDFVAEYIPAPSNPMAGGQSSEVISGNRVVVTSRIVGYSEAPLAGQQWRTYTLTDFNRDDIEQFVTQWTLTFAISVQGDSEPAWQAAKREQQDLLDAIFSRPSVERLAANPLLLTILALIKYTGVILPEQRVKLYELYLQALIESWNLARSLDQYPVGPGINYEETVQVLAPLALWLRRENPTAGLVTQSQLENWLTDYYRREWGLTKGEARQRGRDFLAGVQRYSNLLLERGERQYGFLHLSLEEMLAAQGIAQLLDEEREAALAIFGQYLFDPGWYETLQLALGFIGVVQRRPKIAGATLQELLAIELPAGAGQVGQPVVFAGEALLDMGATNVSRPAAVQVTTALVETMQDAACSVRTRRDAGNLLGRLGWTPEPEADDLLLAPAGHEPTGLDAFRAVSASDGQVWLGKYPVTNRQFARFIEDDGYEHQEFWSNEGLGWRIGMYDSRVPDVLQSWLKNRPPEKRNQPYWWEDRQWNSPLYPVAGVSWFEAEAYARWLTAHVSQVAEWRMSGKWAAVWSKIAAGELVVRLPTEMEWEAAMGGQGEYPWGNDFDKTCLNCSDSWGDEEEEKGLTAVTTYPQGVSSTGIWDGSGNVWEWMINPYRSGGDTVALRGSAWYDNHWIARVSFRGNNLPDDFSLNVGFRLVVAPVWP